MGFSIEASVKNVKTGVKKVKEIRFSDLGGKLRAAAALFPGPKDVKLPKNKEEAKKFAHDFWYGKPHGERRLGDLYCEKTGLYKHREWRGVKDTFYYSKRH